MHPAKGDPPGVEVADVDAAVEQVQLDLARVLL